MGLFRFQPQVEALADLAEIPDDLLPLLVDMQRQLEQRVSIPPEVLFTHAGTPTTDISPRWYPPADCGLGRVFVSADSASSTSSTLTVYRNGVSLGTVVLGTANTKQESFGVRFKAREDYLQVAMTTVGTGLADVCVQAEIG